MIKEELAAAAAHKATVGSYVASGSAFVIGGFTANEFAALGGLTCAAITTIANIYFRLRESKAKEDEIRKRTPN